nr:MAG TPA: hypothetical protein [Caudoviricetes sp.]
MLMTKVALGDLCHDLARFSYTKHRIWRFCSGGVLVWS